MDTNTPYKNNRNRSTCAHFFQAILEEEANHQNTHSLTAAIGHYLQERHFIAAWENPASNPRQNKDPETDSQKVHGLFLHFVSCLRNFPSLSQTNRAMHAAVTQTNLPRHMSRRPTKMLDTTYRTGSDFEPWNPPVVRYTWTHRLPSEQTSFYSMPLASQLQILNPETDEPRLEDAPLTTWLQAFVHINPRLQCHL